MKIRLMGSIEEIEEFKKAIKGAISVSWSEPYRNRRSEDVRVYGDVLTVKGEHDVAFESRETRTKA